MTTPSKHSPPLYRHVIQRLEKNGNTASSSAMAMSPACFLGSDETVSVGKALVIQFWVEALTLSCLRHASFWSSLERTYNDTMLSLLNENEDGVDSEVALEHGIEILTRVEDECALIAGDGNIINDSGDKENFTMAVCILDNRTKFTRISAWTTQQLQAVAHLSSLQLSSDVSNRRCDLLDTKAETMSTTTKQSRTSSLVQYVTLPVRAISRGISYAIDSMLGDEYNLRLNAEGISSHHPSFREELDDGSPDSKVPINILNHVDEDDAVIIAKGVAGISLNHRPLDSTDDIISIGAIVTSCRCLLSYTNQIVMPNSESQEEFFFLCDKDGSVDRIILHKHGFVRGSIGSMCRHCGNYYTVDATAIGLDESDIFLHHSIGNLLSSISEESVNLLTETLVESHYALTDEETITLFPKGIPPNFAKCKSDHALFQIHTTRISIQRRMQHLEQDMETAKQNAITAHRKGMTKSALVHMKRRMAATEELERCACLISNLDASELRLERAKDDAQLVQTYTLLKTALQDIRTNSGIGGVDVEELMLNIQEEMEGNSLESLGVDAVGPNVDEEELNEELRQLESECAVEKSVSEHTLSRESVRASVIEEVTGHREVQGIQTLHKKESLPVHG